MIELFGITMTYEVAAFAFLFLLDEIIPLLPIRANNITQFIARLAQLAAPLRREDEAVKRILEKLSEVQDELNDLKAERRLDDVLRETRQ